MQVVLQSTICKHSLLFSKAVWSNYVYPWCLLFLNICTYVLGKPAVPADSNLHGNQGMCQRSASSPDDLLFSRVKNKQNFLIFLRNKRIKEFVAFLSAHCEWMLKKPQVPGIKYCGIKHCGQLLNIALLHPPDMSSPAQLWGWVLYVKKPSAEIWRDEK